MTVPASDIRFIFYLPNLHSYLDRVELISHIAEKVGRGVLVTSRNDTSLDGLNVKDLEIIEVPRGRRYPGRSAVAASRLVGNLLDTDDFNVVHDTFAHLGPLFWRRRRHRGVVFLTSFYSLAEWDFREWIRPNYGMRTLTDRNLRQWIPRAITQRFITSAADCVVVQAPGLIDRVGQHQRRARSKLAWIPNNVVTPSDAGISQSEGTEIELLWVGGFALGKGGGELLTLLRRAAERSIPVHATVVGSSSPLDRTIRPHVDHLHLRQRIENEELADNIEFISRVAPEEMDRYYRGSDWLFHATYIDGSPRVVIEALVRGLPVIGSKHPGVVVLDPEGRYIHLADPFDADSVLDQLVSEKNDAESHVSRSEAGRDFVREHFSSDAVSDKYVQLYSRLLSERVD